MSFDVRDSIFPTKFTEWALKLEKSECTEDVPEWMLKKGQLTSSPA